MHKTVSSLYITSYGHSQALLVMVFFFFFFFFFFFLNFKMKANLHKPNANWSALTVFYVDKLNFCSGILRYSQQLCAHRHVRLLPAGGLGTTSAALPLVEEIPHHASAG
jgi:hypothetical protein